MKPGGIRSFAVAVLTALLASVVPAGAADWPTFDHDPARSGVDAGDTTLTVSNVARLHARWQISLGTVSDMAPILIDKVRLGNVYRRMLFITANNGETFGIESATGRILWRYETYGPKITTAMPVADPSLTAIYVPGVDGYVHKLDAATGRELRAPGFPARLTRMTQTEKSASALNLANGYLYATTSGYLGDAPPYDGHVLSVRLSDGARHVFNSLCSHYKELPTPASCANSDSGIWGRGGAVVDPDPTMRGAVFAATGNGLFDANSGGDNYGDSVMALTADAAKLLGYYTPTDFTHLQQTDTDLGSTTPALLPRQNRSRTPLMLAQGGKDSIFRLVNRSPLPGVDSELQELSLPAGLFSTPAVWTNGDLTWIFLTFSQEVDGLRLFTNGSGQSRLMLTWRAHPGTTSGEGTSPVVGNGIVFVAFDNEIVALEAHSGRTLWNSAMPSARQTIGPVHWESPIVVNGWVYCADQNGHLTGYSL